MNNIAQWPGTRDWTNHNFKCDVSLAVVAHAFNHNTQEVEAGQFKVSQI